MTTILVPSYDESCAREAAEACGARLADDPHGPQARFGQPARASALARGAVAPLPDWGVLAVSGEEAVKFLHAQTTNDIESQPADEVRLNGYCTPKGRLLACGPLWREEAGPPRLHFAVSRPLAEPLRKRLSMFVLRTKARVEDASNALCVLGLCGAAARPALAELGLAAPEPGRIARAASGGIVALGLRALEPVGERFWLVVPFDALAATWATLTARLAPTDSDTWRALEILAGEPRVLPSTSEAFVPQTLNWELIGGVSFRKGCYPGQEIVARMHYRGKPKRRTFVARLAEGSLPRPGEDLVASGTNDPVGVVVSSAPGLESGSVLLYEAPIEAALAAALAHPDGRALEPLPLPYSVPT